MPTFANLQLHELGVEARLGLVVRVHSRHAPRRRSLVVLRGRPYLRVQHVDVDAVRALPRGLDQLLVRRRRHPGVGFGSQRLL